MTKEDFVRDFQKDLAIKFPHGYQSWWHRFLFHFSDISNITSIFNKGSYR